MDEPQSTKQPITPVEPATTKKNLGTYLKKTQVVLGLESRASQNVLALLVLIVLSTAVLSFILNAPSTFVPGTRVVVADGMSLGEVSLLLQDNGLIRSRVVFEFCAITLGGDKKIMAGEYLFKEPISSFDLASRIVAGVFGVPAIRVTLPEGLSNKEVATILARALTRFDADAFIKSSQTQEGYLFPDTYFFPESATSADVITRMKVNFDKKIKSLATDIDKSGHTTREIVTMASLLEKEVANDEDRAIVSGILWKRISQGMPLQVDATFVYLLGKKSSELTQADLQIKSAYNTYRNKGLPAGPIDNPGLSALQAALHPKDSPYLYYLADKNGVTHYAKTFTEHKANKEKYL